VLRRRESEGESVGHEHAGRSLVRAEEEEEKQKKM
jgi:hypothetical protein